VIPLCQNRIYKPAVARGDVRAVVQILRESNSNLQSSTCFRHNRHKPYFWQESNCVFRSTSSEYFTDEYSDGRDFIFRFSACGVFFASPISAFVVFQRCVIIYDHQLGTSRPRDAGRSAVAEKKSAACGGVAHLASEPLERCVRTQRSSLIFDAYFRPSRACA
jgi:hypothetical protein